jgi:hypothetical protein
MRGLLPQSGLHGVEGTVTQIHGIPDLFFCLAEIGKGQKDVLIGR